ncbi:hypothetical protein GCM10009753_07170 [Streptantibioticus ferralitis]
MSEALHMPARRAQAHIFWMSQSRNSVRTESTHKNPGTPQAQGQSVPSAWAPVKTNAHAKDTPGRVDADATVVAISPIREDGGTGLGRRRIPTLRPAPYPAG